MDQSLGIIEQRGPSAAKTYALMREECLEKVKKKGRDELKFFFFFLFLILYHSSVVSLLPHEAFCFRQMR